MLQVPMSSPDLTQREIDAVVEVVTTRYLSIGPKVDAFEQGLAGYIGARHGVAVNSGTSGLHLAVIGAGVGPGDLVITTPFSFIASSNCVLYEKGIPVFVDVDPVTGNIDPDLVAQAADDLVAGGAAAKRWLPRGVDSESVGSLKAIIPVDAFGQPADMDPIMATAKRHELVVIEDSCESIGATYKGRMAGTLGDVGVFAFYPNKQMTTGEGGMIVTDRDDWNDLYRSLRNQGRDIFDAWLNHSRLGYNYRMDEMSAALGVVQLERIEELLAKRAQVAAWYDARLDGMSLIETPQVVATTTRMSWFVYVIRVAPEAGRNEVMRLLGEKGIPCRPYFTPIHVQSLYRDQLGYAAGDFPVTDRLGDTCLALPFSSVMTEEQVDWVGTCLQEVVEVTRNAR